MAQFSDGTLIAILEKAVRRINRKLKLTGTSSELSVDSDGVVTPDDEDLKDLVLLQAECMISATEFQQDMRDGGGVLVKDGEQTMDTRGSTVARGTFYDSRNSPCEELKHAILDYKMDQTGDFGKMVY